MTRHVPVILALSVIVAACSKTPDERQVQPVPETPDYSHSVGWLHGNCLAIMNTRLTPSMAISVVQPNRPVIVTRARITGRARGSETCKALLEDRRKVNLASGYSFYTVDSKPEINLGIAMLGADTPLDTYRFDYCNTREGVSFTLNAPPARGGAELWRGYYYLGYETEPSCPASDLSALGVR